MRSKEFSPAGLLALSLVVFLASAPPAIYAQNRKACDTGTFISPRPIVSPAPPIFTPRIEPTVPRVPPIASTDPWRGRERALPPVGGIESRGSLLSGATDPGRLDSGREIVPSELLGEHRSSPLILKAEGYLQSSAVLNLTLEDGTGSERRVAEPEPPPAPSAQAVRALAAKSIRRTYAGAGADVNYRY